MDLLDLIIAILVLGAGVHGLRVGAVAQVFAFAGFLLGLGLGAVAISTVDAHVSGALTKTVVALLLLLVPASVLGALARQLGLRVGSALRRVRLGRLDQLAGMATAVAGTLVVCWLFASILVNSSSPTVSRAIEGSTVIRHLESVLPPVPDAFSSVQRYLASSGFPQVLVNILPESIGPVVLPDTAQLHAALRVAAASTVKVVAIGCGQEQEGSGFVTSSGIVVTNAHVIAGTHDITVDDVATGKVETAIPILFDKDFDLAILAVDPLGVPALKVDPSYVGRGRAGVVLGYPEGGPFNAQPAAIVSRFVAQGRDIYGASLTTRTVYELEAIVRPGNSGGPLVSADGEVLGVVFSRSASSPDIGYALASPGVAARLSKARASDQRVGTGACTS